MTSEEKALQYFVIAIPENEEQANAYFYARKYLNAAIQSALPSNPLSLEQLRKMPHGKIKDSTLQSICDRANEVAQPPAHIDREAFCGSWEGEADGYADGELVYDVWRCGDCGHVEETDDPDLLPRFCPDCGRAMTPEAWAELEKRLRG